MFMYAPSFVTRPYCPVTHFILGQSTTQLLFLIANDHVNGLKRLHYPFTHLPHFPTLAQQSLTQPLMRQVIGGGDGR